MVCEIIDSRLHCHFEVPLLLFTVYTCVKGDRGNTVVKVLCYKLEGRWFDPSWCQWTFR